MWYCCLLVWGVFHNSHNQGEIASAHFSKHLADCRSVPFTEEYMFTHTNTHTRKTHEKRTARCVKWTFDVNLVNQRLPYKEEVTLNKTFTGSGKAMCKGPPWARAQEFWMLSETWKRPEFPQMLLSNSEVRSCTLPFQNLQLLGFGNQQVLLRTDVSRFYDSKSAY